MSVLGLLTGMLPKAVDLASEYILDKDKAAELVAKMNVLYNDALKSAREHDKASYGDVLVDRLRGLVRPVCTMIAISWYVYARVNDIALGHEDYAIIGGILAFWFGFRPFDKRK